MTEIPQNTLAARVVATPSPASRKAPAPAPAAAARVQAPSAAAVRVEAKADSGAAEKTEAPANAPANAVDTVSTTASSAVEPLSPNGPTRVTAYSDASSGRYVIQVREAESNEVINQYPPKELLRFYAAAREALEQAVERSAKAKDVSA